MLDPENIPRNFQDLGIGHSPEVIPEGSTHQNSLNPPEEGEVDSIDQPDTEPAAPSLTPSQASMPGSTDQNVLPENIPVPETEEEDELFANVFHMQEDQCWQLEFPLGYSEINHLSNAAEPQEAIAYLETNAKKQKVEVRM